jgi:GT2 family glycosyltransferase
VGSDGSGEWAEAENIDHTCSKENIGVCRALNSAYTLAASDYIVYLNDDMYVCPDWDHHLWEAIRQVGHERFFISSTAIEPKDVGKGCAIAPHFFGRSIKDFDEERLLEQYERFTFADWNGASWPPNVVHRTLWEQVGGYSTEFYPGFYSDPDFAMKLWQAGVRDFRGVGTSRVYHFLEVSTNKLKKQMVKQANGQFLRKWGVTARMFNLFYLRMGTPYHGAVPEPEKTLGYAWKRLCCMAKKIFV